MTNLHRLKTLLIAGIVAILALSPAYAKRNLKSSPRLPLLPTWRKTWRATQRKSARLPSPALKSMSISQRPAILNERRGTAYPREWSEPERWFARFISTFPAYRKSSSPPASNRWALPKARITVNRTRTHGCRQKTLIYVDNIRDATVKYDPDNAQIYKQNAERYKAKIRQMADPLRAELEKFPPISAGWSPVKARFSYGAR